MSNMNERRHERHMRIANALLATVAVLVVAILLAMLLTGGW